MGLPTSLDPPRRHLFLLRPHGRVPQPGGCPPRRPGIVNSEDVALLLSNSGETDELLAILPYLKRRGTARMALVGRVNSSLASGCNVVLNGSVDREVCPPTWPSPQARP